MTQVSPHSPSPTPRGDSKLVPPAELPTGRPEAEGEHGCSQTPDSPLRPEGASHFAPFRGRLGPAGAWKFRLKVRLHLLVPGRVGAPSRGARRAAWGAAVQPPGSLLVREHRAFLHADLHAPRRCFQLPEYKLCIPSAKFTPKYLTLLYFCKWIFLLDFIFGSSVASAQKFY